MSFGLIKQTTHKSRHNFHNSCPGKNQINHLTRTQFREDLILNGQQQGFKILKLMFLFP